MYGSRAGKIVEAFFNLPSKCALLYGGAKSLKSGCGKPASGSKGAGGALEGFDPEVLVGTIPAEDTLADRLPTHMPDPEFLPEPERKVTISKWSWGSPEEYSPRWQWV